MQQMTELYAFSGVVPVSDFCRLLKSLHELASFGTSVSLLVLSLAALAFCTSCVLAIVLCVAFAIFLCSYHWYYKAVEYQMIQIKQFFEDIIQLKLNQLRLTKSQTIYSIYSKILQNHSFNLSTFSTKLNLFDFKFASTASNKK